MEENWNEQLHFHSVGALLTFKQTLFPLLLLVYMMRIQDPYSVVPQIFPQPGKLMCKISFTSLFPLAFLPHISACATSLPQVPFS